MQGSRNARPAGDGRPSGMRPPALAPEVAVPRRDGMGGGTSLQVGQNSPVTVVDRPTISG
jgi:hypothetical protein